MDINFELLRTLSQHLTYVFLLDSGSVETTNATKFRHIIPKRQGDVHMNFLNESSMNPP